MLKQWEVERPACWGPVRDFGCFCCGNFNHRWAPAEEGPLSAQIILFNQPGLQTLGPAGTSPASFLNTQPLTLAYSQNGFDDSCINFADEMLQSYVLCHAFENSIADNGLTDHDIANVTLPSINYEQQSLHGTFARCSVKSTTAEDARKH